MQVFAECDASCRAYPGHLIQIEYTDQPAAMITAACAARGRSASVVLRDREVAPPTDQHHVERWCP